MKLRYFILSLLFISYGTILGHELIYGHHTNAEVTTHHDHDSGCCDDHNQGSGHIPCTFDIKPHFITPALTVDRSKDLADSGNYGYFLFEKPARVILPEPEKEVPPDLIIPGIYSVSISRSLGLRGPPAA